MTSSTHWSLKLFTQDAVALLVSKVNTSSSLVDWSLIPMQSLFEGAFLASGYCVRLTSCACLQDVLQVKFSGTVQAERWGAELITEDVEVVDLQQRPFTVRTTDTEVRSICMSLSSVHRLE